MVTLGTDAHTYVRSLLVEMLYLCAHLGETMRSRTRHPGGTGEYPNSHSVRCREARGPRTRLPTLQRSASRDLRSQAQGTIWGRSRVRLLLPTLPKGYGLRSTVVPVPWVNLS